LVCLPPTSLSPLPSPLSPPKPFPAPKPKADLLMIGTQGGKTLTLHRTRITPHGLIETYHGLGRPKEKKYRVLDGEIVCEGGEEKGDFVVKFEVRFPWLTGEEKRLLGEVLM
jgi:hypothetical protein